MAGVRLPVGGPRVSTKRNRRTGKSHVGKKKRRTKETKRETRYRVSAGEDFPDLRQPSRREVWLDRLKRFLKWAGGVSLGAAVGKLIKFLVDRSLD